MPELPEVETVANGVHARIHGQTIRSVWTSNKPQTFKSPPELIAETLTGARVDRVHRVGKTVAFDLTRKVGRSEKPAQFLVHLGMTGRLLVSAPETPHPAHTHAILTLSGGQELRFVDARRFGRLSVVDQPYTGPGREPLTISLEDFIALFRGRKTPIKAALLNQKLLHGVGNIYADEALFHAGIRPRRHAGRLTREELKRLHAALVKVLKKAIKLGGRRCPTMWMRTEWRVFFSCITTSIREQESRAGICGTPIERIVIGGRSTHFCPTCQK